MQGVWSPIDHKAFSCRIFSGGERKLSKNVCQWFGISSHRRRVFKANLADYCQIDGQDIYEERVFELSSLSALRKRIKNANASLEGTGFPELMGSLDNFLVKERAIAQLRQARTLAKQTYNRVREAVERRIPLLEQDIQEVKTRIDSVAPEFELLTEIRDDFQQER